MLKTIVGLAPFALGVAVFGGVIWFLLGRNIGLGKWLLAAFLMGHGFVQMMFLFPRPATAAATAGGVEYPFDMARSWLITGVGLDPGAVRAIGVALVAAVAIGFVLAGLASVGLLIPSGWWQGLVVGSTVASLALMTVFFSPGLLIGFAIDAVLLWVALASVWTPAVAFAQRAGAG